MHPGRRAVIDVGTNSVKLLVAEVDGHVVRPVWEEGNQTRLGEGFFDTRRLQRRAIDRTIEAVAEFVNTARAHGAGHIRVVGTSAVREADNGAELTQALASRTGLALEVISGDQEAEWAYLGVTSGETFRNRRLLIVDAGGGSTEFLLGEGEQRLFRRSFPLGAVRLLERLAPSDPPRPQELDQGRTWLREFFRERLRPGLPHEALEPDRTWLVGTGGTAVILARMALGIETYEREAIESLRLQAGTLSEWVERLWRLPLAERRKIPGLPPPRADVILTGALIYEAAALHLGFAELRASTRGLRFAALVDSAPSDVPPPPGSVPAAGAQAEPALKHAADL